MTDKPLNTKQDMFCREYIVDLNGTTAAIRAGYSQDTAAEQACRLLRDVRIKARVNQLLSERTKRVEISSDYVLGGIVEVIERCKQAEPVRDRDGTPTGEYKFESGSALKGYELLAKHLKLLTDRVEQDVAVTLKDISADPIEMTSDQWLEKATSSVGPLNPDRSTPL
jgi:phage terminase small subunit